MICIILPASNNETGALVWARRRLGGADGAAHPARLARGSFRQPGRECVMTLAPGITRAGEGLDNISWNILGQIYVPKEVSLNSFAWHATFPPETFVPPHIHPTQDEFIYMFEGQLELMLDGREAFANPGDLVRMPMGLPHADRKSVV